VYHYTLGLVDMAENWITISGYHDNSNISSSSWTLK